MASDPPSSESGTPDGGRTGGGLSPVRAFLVLVAFVVAVVALVDVGTRPRTDVEAQPPAVTTTTAAGTGPSTTTTTVPRSTVSVLVANATSQAGLAGHYTSVLTAQGWALKTATDASTTVASSAVYYAAGQQEAAASIATTLGLQPHAVLPLTASVPVPGASGNDIVVVVGADLVTAAGT